MRTLPLVDVPLGYRRLLFPDNEGPAPVVYFSVAERFTSLHQFRRRLVFISTLGTLYICNPQSGFVTHTMSLSDTSTPLEMEADSSVRTDGRRALLLHKPNDTRSALVLVFDCSATDQCASFFQVVVHFARNRLKVTTSDNLLRSVADEPREGVFSRFFSRVMADDDADRRLMSGVSATLRPRLVHRSSTHVANDGTPPRVMDHARPRDGESAADDDDHAVASEPPASGASPSPSSIGAVRAPSGGEGVDTDGLRRRMQRLYMHYCPDRLPTLEAALVKHAGNEEALLHAMITKYGPEPPDDGHETRTIRALSVRSARNPTILEAVSSGDDDDEGDGHHAGSRDPILASSSFSASPGSQRPFKASRSFSGRSPPKQRPAALTATQLQTFQDQHAALEEHANHLMDQIAELELDAAMQSAEHQRRVAQLASVNERINRPAVKQEIALASLVMSICERTVRERHFEMQARLQREVSIADQKAKSRLVRLLGGAPEMQSSIELDAHEML